MPIFLDPAQHDAVMAVPTVPDSMQAAPGELYLLEAEIDQWWLLSSDDLDAVLDEWVDDLELEVAPRVEAVVIWNDSPNPLASPTLFVALKFPPTAGLVAFPALWAIAVIIGSIAAAYTAKQIVFSVSTTPDPWRRISATFLAALTDDEVIDDIASGPIDPGLGEEVIDLERERARRFVQAAWPFAVVAGSLVFLTMNRK